MNNDKLKTPEDLRHSTGVQTEETADHMTSLKELFDTFEEAAKKEKLVINHNFEASEGERRPPHAALLQKTASELRSSPSLRDKVRGILGE